MIRTCRAKTIWGRVFAPAVNGKHAIAAGVCFLASCVSSATPETPTLDVETAIRDAVRLDGTVVSVRGYLVFDFEDHGLYASRRDYMDDDLCISLEFGADHAAWEKRDHRVVIVTGTLEADFCTQDMICLSACNQVGLSNVEIAPR